MSEKRRSLTELKISKGVRSQGKFSPTIPVTHGRQQHSKEDRFNPYLSQKLKIHQQEHSPRKSKLVLTRSSTEMSNSIFDTSSREAVFDNISSAIMEGREMGEAFESELKQPFSADKVLFYHDIMAVQSLFCPSESQVCPHGSGLVGYCHFTRELLNIPTAAAHISYNATYDMSYDSLSPVLVFPLFDYQERIRAIILITRDHERPVFSDADEKYAAYIQNKVRTYSRWLFEPKSKLSAVQELVHVTRVGPFIEYVTDRLAQTFSCKKVEIWSYNEESGEIGQFTGSTGKPILVVPSDAGIPGFVLTGGGTVSAIHSNYHAAYNKKSDGMPEQSILALPYHHPIHPIMYAIVLRDKRYPNFFTDEEELALADLAPIVISALNASEIVERATTGIENANHSQNRLESLLNVAQVISGQLQFESLIPTIMNHACDLVKADRCSLFLVSENRDKLVTSFQRGLKNALEVPINSGIVGHTATTGQILNVRDAYEDPRFNRSTDLATGYRTHNLLCVPIFDNKNVLKGVTEMINKDTGSFTDEDVRSIQVMNIFVEIAIENARLYHASIDLSLQLRTIIQISQSLAKQNVKQLTESVMQNSRQVIGAHRAMLFINNPGEEFPSLFASDEDIESKMRRSKLDGEEQRRATNKKVKIIRKMIAGVSDLTPTEDSETHAAIVKSVIDSRQGTIINNPNVTEESLIIAPVCGSDGMTIGALIMQWPKRETGFTEEDMNLMESFAVFISISLEKTKLHEAHSIIDVKRREAMTETETNTYDTPTKMRIHGTVFTRNASYDQTELGRIQICFAAFDEFQLREQFDLPNSKFYELICRIAGYSGSNWEHSVETLRFTVSLVSESGLTYPKTTLIALFLASLAFHAGANPVPLAGLFNVASGPAMKCTLLYQASALANVEFDDETWKLIADLTLSASIRVKIDDADPHRSVKLILQVSTIGRAIRSLENSEHWLEYAMGDFTEKDKFLYKYCMPTLCELEKISPSFAGMEEEARQILQDREEKRIK